MPNFMGMERSGFCYWTPRHSITGDLAHRPTASYDPRSREIPGMIQTSGRARWVQLLVGIVGMVVIANLQYGWTLFEQSGAKAIHQRDRRAARARGQPRESRDR